MDDPFPGRSRDLVGASAQNPIGIIPIGRTALGKPSTAAQGRPGTAKRFAWIGRRRRAVADIQMGARVGRSIAAESAICKNKNSVDSNAERPQEKIEGTGVALD